MLPKLVRDKIPGIIVKDGKIPICTFVDDVDVKPYLFNKIKEEVSELEYECTGPEFDREKILEEFADVFEALERLGYLYGLDTEEVVLAIHKKREKCGQFKDNIILTDIILGGEKK